MNLFTYIYACIYKNTQPPCITSNNKKNVINQKSVQKSVHLKASLVEGAHSSIDLGA